MDPDRKGGAEATAKPPSLGSSLATGLVPPFQSLPFGQEPVSSFLHRKKGGGSERSGSAAHYGPSWHYCHQAPGAGSSIQVGAVPRVLMSVRDTGALSLSVPCCALTVPEPESGERAVP